MHQLHKSIDTRTDYCRKLLLSLIQMKNLKQLDQTVKADDRALEVSVKTFFGNQKAKN